MRFLPLICAALLSINSIAFALPNSEIPSDKQTLLAAHTPPGLQKKGLTGVPYTGKVPPGWNEGLKRGWNKNSDWRWNKKTKLWQNKYWRWDAPTETWIRISD